MLVTEMLKIAPTPEQADALLATMRACNAAANRAAEVGALDGRRGRRHPVSGRGDARVEPHSAAGHGRPR